jgi:hypothetical protein
MSVLDFHERPRGPRRKYIGKCIYCGATENLTTEHALPESLNGDLMLEAASCRECARITGGFEGRYTGETLKPARTVLGMKTKRKKDRPKEFPIEIIKDGVSTFRNLSVEEHMAVIPMWQLGPPGKYPLDRNADGLRHGEARLIVFNTRSDGELATLAEKYDADEIKVHFRLYFEEFLLMIAKMAYCFAVDKYGLNQIAEAYIVPAILGKKRDIHYWVGGDGYQELYDISRGVKADHVVVAGVRQGEIRVRLKLFKDLRTPEYYVIVGRLSDAVRGVYESVGLKGA